MSRLNAPKCIGIDARMLSMAPTGVGNYIASLLAPMSRSNPDTKFILYSNSRVGLDAQPNLIVTEGGAHIGPVWMNFQLPFYLWRDRVDVFWAANGVSPVIGTVPVVLTVHDLVYRFAADTMKFGARWTKRAFQGGSVRRASRVVAVSESTAADVAAVYGRQVDAVVPPLAGAAMYRREPASTDEVRVRFGLPQRYWLCAGTMEPRKNLAGMVAAYLQCLSRGLALPSLVLAGAQGWDDARLGELIAQGEASGHVRRLGYVTTDELASLYSGCEAFWMPSVYEGFGMPILEAQCCGAPVVHGNHRSMLEASGGLGVATGTDVASLCQMIDAVVRREAPLTCRLVKASEGDAEAAALGLWDLICSAKPT
jgi:glycosyltransferase involved in cell wall biosynthesis